MTRTAAVAFAAGVALLAPSAAQARSQETMVIKVTSVSVKLTTNDTPPKGASKGDTVVYYDNLLNAAPQFGQEVGAKVGIDRGTMTFTGAHSARFKGFARLPGGTVTLSGPVQSAPDGKSIIIPVTGGTGKFKGARGSVLVGPGEKRALNTYTLNLPVVPIA